MSEQDDCPILPLARQYDVLLRQHIECDGDNDGVWERMDDLVNAASYLMPRCLMGAAFQMMCASSEIDRTSDADTASVRRGSTERVYRLSQRAASYLSQHMGELPHTLEYMFISPAHLLAQEVLALEAA